MQLNSNRDERKEFNFDVITEFDYYQKPRKTGTFIRNNWIILFVIINCVTLSVMAFFLTGGHPIEAISNIFNKSSQSVKNTSESTVHKSYQELLQGDISRIRQVIDEVMGKHVQFSVSPYEPKSVETLKMRYLVLGQSRGNLFTKVNGQYHYLSNDGKRLYRCEIPSRGSKAGAENGTVFVHPPLSVDIGQAVTRPAITRESAPVTVTRENNRRSPVDVREEIYKDEDGFWRNRKVYVEYD